MNKHKIIVIAFMLIATLMIIVYYQPDDIEPLIIDGYGDVKLAEMLDDEIIKLNGTWAFYWGQLLEPDYFVVENNIVPAYMQVPGTWAKDVFGKQYPDKGAATYRTVIYGLESDVTYGIKKQNIRFASKIFINGALVHQDGTPAVNNEQEIMGNYPRVIYFEASNNQAELIIQASNHKYFNGGIVKPIYFGQQQAITRNNEKQIAFEVMTIILIIGTGIIYVIIATLIPSFRKREPIAIVFPFVIILFALMSSTLNERVIRLIIIDIPSETLIKFEHVVICLLIIALAWFIFLIEKRFVSKSARNIITIFYSIYIIAIIITPIEKFDIVATFSVVNLLVLLGLLIIIGYHYIKSTELQINLKEHSFLLVLLFIANIYNVDIVAYSIGLKDNMTIALIASNIYVLTWLGLMASRYEEVFMENQELTIALIESNYNLDKYSSKASRSEIAFLQAQIKPHFLFNALSSIISLGKANSPKSLELLIYLSNYLKFSFNANFSSEYIYLQSEIEIIDSYTKIEEARFSERLKFNIEVDSSLLKQKIIPLLIQPLVENAIRHGALKTSQAQGLVNLSIEKNEEYIRVIIEDNGPGFTQKLKEMLFENSSNDNEITQGIGIMNINSRLNHYYQEKLFMENCQPGAKVWFRIPMGKEM